MIILFCYQGYAIKLIPNNYTEVTVAKWDSH